MLPPFLRIYGIASQKVLDLINTHQMKWPQYESSLILLIDYSDFDIPIGSIFTTFLEIGNTEISRWIEGELIQVTQSWLKPFDCIPRGHKSIVEIKLNEKGFQLLSEKLLILDAWGGDNNRFKISID